MNSARGAGRFLSDAISAARKAGAGPVIRCRLDSAFYNHNVVAAIMKGKAQFSITARLDKAVQKAISSIPEDAWVHIEYPEAIFDVEQQRWISDAQVAETEYTAFTSKGRKHKVTARLIVRRVKRLNPKTAPPGQDELFSVHRHHAVFTNSIEPMLLAESHHRDHAIVEQVIADLKSSALGHFPSAQMNANAAWLTCAVIAHNLARAAGVLAGGKLAKARTGTIRTKLINIPARISSTARTYTLHGHDAQQRIEPFNLVVPVPDTLLLVPVGFPHRVINIEPAHGVAVIVVPGQQRHQLGQRGQEPHSDRTQLPNMTEGERPQERAQRRRRLHPWQHLPDGTLPQHIQVINTVRAGEHPGHDRAHLRRSITPGTTWHCQLRGHPGAQPRAAGQSHHRDQPGRADHVRFIEGRVDLRDLG